MTTPGWKAPSGRSKTKCWGKPCPPITRRPNDNSLSASKAGITSAAATVPWAINRQLLLKRSSWKINHNKITSAPVHLLGGTSHRILGLHFEKLAIIRDAVIDRKRFV